MPQRLAVCCVWFSVLFSSATLRGADWTLRENPNLAKYFESQVRQIESEQSLMQFRTLKEWEHSRQQLREQLFDMLGFDPHRERTPLRVEQHGALEEQEFRVEKLWIQTLPGLYVTASYYLPREVKEPLPTILYVCGHARMKGEDGRSYGNKTGYQHHGAWFARNGYTCLTIDTLQLGEIEGIHHGTYRHNRWWWNSRGYTPAGVEAWNCIRALDYLQSRSEVDGERIGVTGRSGGGAYSWWIAALDDRIKCAVPVAGITSLRNHVVDGCVEGHCDCMYMVNTFRWDYATVAALMAPRPLLISNSDKDRIFPLEGVVDVHRQVRHIYQLYEQPQNLGLQITEGPHRDTQELRVHAFRWFNRWLKKDDRLIDTTATKFFEPAQLRVFSELPKDERNTTIDEDFAPLAPESSRDRMQRVLQNQSVWAKSGHSVLRSRCFAAWPDDATLEAGEVTSQPLPVAPALSEAAAARRLRFSSQEHVPLQLDFFEPLHGRQPKSTKIRLLILNDSESAVYMQQCLAEQVSPATTGPPDDTIPVAEHIRQRTARGECVAVFCPRGTGPHAWRGDEKKQIQIRRRFQLIGTTADAMRVWDVRSAIAVLRRNMDEAHVEISGQGISGWIALTAGIFEGSNVSLDISRLDVQREAMPVYLNFARHFSPEELLALGLHATQTSLTESHSRLHETYDFLTGHDEWRGVTGENGAENSRR